MISRTPLMFKLLQILVLFSILVTVTVKYEDKLPRRVGWFKRSLCFATTESLFSSVDETRSPPPLGYKLATTKDIFGSTIMDSYNESLTTGERENEFLKTFYDCSLQPPGVILRAKGGIGNQLFQYACSYGLAKDLNWPLYVRHDHSFSVIRWFESDKRVFVMDLFKVPLDNIIDESTEITGEIEKDDQEYLERSFLQEEDIDRKFIMLSQSGYCQSAEYWRKHESDIKAMFKLRNWAINWRKLERIINKIRNTEQSVAVHVRGGDFKRNYDSHIPLSFQRQAIRKMFALLTNRGPEMREPPVFYIFTDDIDCAKRLKDLGDKYELVFVTEMIPKMTSIDVFYLMSLCKNIIFPNSTFSWWVAYLMENVNKTVITTVENPTYARESWWKKEIYWKLFYPNDWLVMNPFTGRLLSNSNNNFTTKF